MIKLCSKSMYADTYGLPMSFNNWKIIVNKITPSLRKDCIFIIILLSNQKKVYGLLTIF